MDTVWSLSIKAGSTDAENMLLQGQSWGVILAMLNLIPL